jgi:hypothetical protein
MTACRFIPVVEQLEAKLLLAGLPVPTTIDETHLVDAAQEGSQSSLEEINLSTERDGDANILVVRMGELSKGCTVCLAGGETVVADSDGNARLHLPSDAQNAELTFRDAHGELLGSVRLELGEGHIVREAWSNSQHSQDEVGQYVLVPANHSGTLHSMNLPGSPVVLEQSDASHNSSAMNAEVDAHAVDVVMAHSLATPVSLPGNNHISAASHFSRGERVSFRHEVIAEEDDAGSEVASNHSEIPAAASHEIGAELSEAAVEENIDAIVANWTAGEEPAMASLPAESLASATTPTPEPTIQEVKPAAIESAPIVDPTSVVFAAYVSHLPTSAETNDATESNHGSVIGGLVVSALAATAAVVFDRKAKRDLERCPVSDRAQALGVSRETGG